MKTLQDEVQARGYTVAHIKTDSIKIPDGDKEIIDFCMEFAQKYGYTFEHEATYEKMCLVNNAVFIAKYDWAEKKRLIGQWDAVGAQFAEPYVFKTLFTQEPVHFNDYKQVKSVTSPAVIYLDFNEGLPEGEHKYVHVGRVGSFVPVMPGTGGAHLMRMKDGKYTAVVGSKGYLWKESDIIEKLNQEDQVDLLYFNTMVNTAVKTIEKFGSIDDFLDFSFNNVTSEEPDLIGFGAATSVIRGAVGVVGKMIDNVRELDKALVELSKVSDLNGDSLKKFTEEAFEAGKTVARTGTEMISAATEFAKAGYGEEQIIELGRIASRYCSIMW